MKNYLRFLLFLVLFAGCVPQQHPLTKINREVNYYGFDFTEYAEEGFHITPEPYQGGYTPVGLLAIEIYPEAKYAVTGRTVDANGYPVTQYEWIVTKDKAQSAIDSLVSIGKTMGANAIVNFKYSSVTKNYSRLTNPTFLEGYRVEGFAIKREF